MHPVAFTQLPIRLAKGLRRRRRGGCCRRRVLGSGSWRKSSSPGSVRAAPAASAIVNGARSTPAASLDAFIGDPNFMTSLARGLLVIQAFTPQNPQMSIAQLATKTGISRAAVRRCLYTLAKLGFAGAEEGSRYALRPHLMALSNSYSTSNSLSTSAQPMETRLCMSRAPRYRA